MWNLWCFVGILVAVNAPQLTSGTDVNPTTHFHNSSGHAPFEVMRPDLVNPVASLPEPTATADPVTHIRVTRHRLRRRQIGGIEVAHGENYSFFPTSEIMATWTVTPPAAHSMAKRNAEEHSFRLPLPATGAPSANATSGTIIQVKAKRSMKGNDRQADMQPVSTSSSVFEGVQPSVDSRAGAFVDKPGRGSDSSGHRGTLEKRSVGSSTTRRSTTDDGWGSDGSGQASGMGLATPGNFLGV